MVFATLSKTVFSRSGEKGAATMCVWQEKPRILKRSEQNLHNFTKANQNNKPKSNQKIFQQKSC